MTPQEFSAKIKAKNPSLQMVDDVTLAHKVLDAHPELKGQVDFGKEVPKPVLETAKPQPQQKEKGLLETASNAVDKTLGRASNFLFGSASKTIGTAIAAPILEAQGKYQAADKLVKENIKPGNIAFTALELYPGGGLLTKALKKLPGGEATAKLITESIPEGLRAKAIKQYSEALGATTKELKSKTANISPKLLSQKVTGTLPKLQSMAESKMATAGEAIKKASDNIPIFKQTQVKPLIDKVANMRNQYIINGKVIDKAAVKAIDTVVESITQYGTKIPDTQLLKIRRVLDKSVAIANKNFTKEEGLSLATEAKQGIANAIRKTLNSENPKFGAANAEFSLWSDVNKVVSATLERRSSQGSGITRFVGPLVGAGGIGAATGDVIKGAIGYFATDAAIKLFQSPLYKTISAVQKEKLAEYLASGKIKEATLLTTKLLNGLKNENNQ